MELKMLFDISFWPQALLFGAAGAAVFLILSFLAVKRSESTYKLAALSFVLVLLASRIMLYYGMPSFQGVLGGFWWPALVTLLPATSLGLLAHKHRLGTLAGSLFLCVFLLLMLPLGQTLYSNWGPGNKLRFASLPKISVAAADANIPPTDPNKIVTVSKSVAVFKGQTALTSDKSQNLGSRFYVEASSYVLQSVRGHRYWIAPLRFTNNADAYWGPLFGLLSESPGYVVVDAQNPHKDAWVKLDFHMTVFNDGYFASDLYRHLYQAGYTGGDLVAPKFEVDDNWRPHWVVSYVRYPLEGVAGKKIERVIVLDVSEAQPKVSDYAMGEQPEWIERAMPFSILKTYMQDWGYWNNDYARQNPWKVYFGWRKDGSTQPSEYDLNYTTDNHSVWVVPMTSMNASDHAISGIVVFETTRNEAVFYPGIRGFNEGRTVRDTIAHAPVLLGKNLGVDQLQLYSIYGELTWVAVITNPQSTGMGYAGIALLHAHGQNASEVIFAPDLDRALRQYASQLANKDKGSTSNIARNSQQKQGSGRVLGIGVIPGNMQQPNQWVFMIEGDARTFTVNRETYGKIPMVKEGDLVSFTYLELPGNEELAVSTFVVERLDRGVNAAPRKEPAVPGQP